MRLALAAWGRNPRELGLANALAFLAAALPLPLLIALPSGLARAAGVALWLAWAWLCFNALAFSCARILGPGWRAGDLKAWAQRHALERLLALLGATILMLWAGLALAFYLKQGLPLWATVPVLGLLGSLLLWAALALLVSVGVAAMGTATWRQAWKASALFPLAYAPSCLGAGLLALGLSGLPALLIGLKHWSAPLLFAPVALSPFFTAAFLAAFLVLLVRGLAESAAGGEGPLAPEWRELWNPWR